MSVLGNGGMITTNVDILVQFAKDYREHGSNYGIGYNSRMNTILASIGRVQLRYLDIWNKERKSLANIYTDELQDIPVGLQADDDGRTYSSYVIEVEHRNELQKKLSKEGIATGIHYKMPLPLETPFRRYSNDGFVNAMEHCSKNLTLPLYIGIDEETIKKICNIIKKCYRRKK